MNSTTISGFDEDRLAKRAALRQDQHEPYTYERTHVLEDLPALEGSEETVRVTGRIWARRDMGKVLFMDLRDHRGQIQLFCAQKGLSPTQWQGLSALDQGDLIGVEGTIFRTRTGELSIAVAAWILLAKALVPLPIGKETDERTYYRVEDPETRYRERHLHWLVDRTDRERIYQRARIVSALRRGLEEADFIEVDTPILDTSYGGADARPFQTEIWALDHQPAYLRIALELHLKRYLIAGFDRVFALGPQFRNEGIDRTHNPEFAMVEWYEAYTDYHDQMRRVESLVSCICEQLHGSTRVEYQGITLNFAAPWQRLSMLEALRQFADIDADALDADALGRELDRRGIPREGKLSWGQATVELFESLCLQHLVQPTFITDHPREISPLTRSKRGDDRLVERFEAYVNGIELADAYSELTDPVEQLARFEAQERQEGHPPDREFLRALGCGMPPAGGVGLGVDRLVMLLTDAASIRDCIPFPMVKPRV